MPLYVPCESILGHQVFAGRAAATRTRQNRSSPIRSAVKHHKQPVTFRCRRCKTSNAVDGTKRTFRCRPITESAIRIRAANDDGGRQTRLSVEGVIVADD